MPGFPALLVAVAYVLAAGRLRRRGDARPRWRDVSFTVGGTGTAWAAVAFTPADLYSGVQWMYYGGDVVEAALAVVLGVGRYMADGRAGGVARADVGTRRGITAVAWAGRADRVRGRSRAPEPPAVAGTASAVRNPRGFLEPGGPDAASGRRLTDAGGALGDRQQVLRP